MAELQNIKVAITRYKKQGSKWAQTEKEEHFNPETYVKNIIEARRFFTNLGGYERHEKGHTKHGYRVIRVISISPNRDLRTIYEFDFDTAD